MSTRYVYGLLFAILYSIFGALAAFAQEWGAVLGEGEMYLSAGTSGALTDGGDASGHMAALIVRCGGELPALPVVMFQPVKDADPPVVSLACEEDNEFCSEETVPIQFLVAAEDGNSVVKVDTAGIRDGFFLYPRTEAQKDRWLLWLNTGSEFGIAFDWYQKGMFEWKWDLSEYAEIRDKHCG